jgi:hypothetical protein
MPYLYCFEVKGLFNDKTVYKFGKTNQNNVLDRINAYSGLNKPKKFIIISYVDNADLLEKKILHELRLKYNFCKELGNEYFYSDNNIELHRFLLEMEIKYYDFKENDIVQNKNILNENISIPNKRIECPFNCGSPRASKEKMINHLEKQCKRRPSNTLINTIKCRSDVELLKIDSKLENIVSQIWNCQVINKIQSLR